MRLGIDGTAPEWVDLVYDAALVIRCDPITLLAQPLDQLLMSLRQADRIADRMADHDGP